MENTEYIYVLGDGDKIRERIEAHLLNNEIELLSEVSQSIIDAISEMVGFSSATMNAEKIMAGGDDLLLRIKKNLFKLEKLKTMIQIFQSKVGNQFSVGIGNTIESAYINLRRAKSSAKKIVGESDLK